VTLVGHSTGGGEITRYIGRHGSARIAQLVLVSAVPPLMVRQDDNPDGLPLETFDGIRAGEAANRSQLYRDLADGPFFGHNRTGDVPQGTRDAFWLQGLASGTHGAYACIAAFSATDFRSDLAAVDVPTLIIHGDDDQIVPFEISGRLSAQLVPDAQLIVYEGGAHGLPDTDRDRLHADLLTFLRT
jgi:non-heme chloroperoxidase